MTVMITFFKRLLYKLILPIIFLIIWFKLLVFILQKTDFLLKPIAYIYMCMFLAVLCAFYWVIIDDETD